MVIFWCVRPSSKEEKEKNIVHNSKAQFRNTNTSTVNPLSILKIHQKIHQYGISTFYTQKHISSIPNTGQKTLSLSLSLMNIHQKFQHGGISTPLIIVFPPLSRSHVQNSNVPQFLNTKHCQSAPSLSLLFIKKFNTAAFPLPSSFLLFLTPTSKIQMFLNF